MTLCGVALEIGSPLEPGDKEGPSRVVTPRFFALSASPLVSLNQSPQISANRIPLICTSPPLPSLPSFIPSRLFLFLPVVPNVSPFHFSLSLLPFSRVSLFPCPPSFSASLLDANCCHVLCRQVRTSPARCPFISFSLLPHPPSSTGLPSPLSLPRHGFCPCSL